MGAPRGLQDKEGWVHRPAVISNPPAPQTEKDDLLFTLSPELKFRFFPPLEEEEGDEG